MRKIQGSVVVLVGASSGIGRAAALAFAREGAKLVLAARDGAALDDVARACTERGAEALAVPTDVLDEPAVGDLRDRAVERFGRIDTWVHDAAVYMLGRFEETPPDAFRAVLETNVMGFVHGAKAALSHFRAEGKGTLIVVGSVAGKVSYAQASAYCASKHAIHATVEALRQELVGSDIDACIVAPATVDTPLFQHAANFTGREIVAMPPIYRPDRVARAILSCARRPRREVLVGAAPRVMTLSRLLVPALFERVQARVVAREHLGPAPRENDMGNVPGPRPPHAIDGGWKLRRSRLARLVFGRRPEILGA